MAVLNKLFVMHPELIEAAGHVYTESQAWVRACAARRIALGLFGHRDCDPAVAESLGARRIFALTPDILGRYMTAEERHGRQSPDIAPLTDFTLRADCTTLACEEAWTGEGDPPDLIAFPWADAGIMNGAASWLTSLPPDQRPKLLFNFVRPEPGWAADAERRTVHGDFSYFRFAARRLRALAGRQGLALTAVEGRLCRLIEDLAQVACPPAPLHQYYPDPMPRPVPGEDGRLRISFLGLDRDQKGGAVLGDVIAQICQVAPSARIFVQVSTRARADAISSRLGALRSNAEVLLHIGALATDAYFQRLIESDLTVQPYEAVAYALMPSGIFADAVAAGVPVVTPARTWMADRLVEGWCAGAMFHDPSAIAAAVEAAIERLPALKAQAGAKAAAWRQAQCLDAYIDHVLPRLGLKSPPAPKAARRRKSG